MGSRNLTMVKNGGKIVVAQYAQHGADPSESGAYCLEFLSKHRLPEFKEQLRKVRFLDFEGRDKKFLEDFDKNVSNKTDAQRHWFNTYRSRSIGAEILDNILTSNDDEILLSDALAFVYDSWGCEWAYLIDLDENKFQVFQGYQKTILDKSQPFFKDEPDEHGYYACKMVVELPLDVLPTEVEFVAMFEEEEDNDVE